MKGRPPKPIALHIAEGTLRPSRHGRKKPRSMEKKPKCPASLKKHARRMWNQLVGQLMELNLLDELDLLSLEAACRTFGLLMNAQEEAERSPHNKEARIAVKDFDDRFRKWVDQFGLSPVARARARVDTSEKPAGVASRSRGKKSG